MDTEEAKARASSMVQKMLAGRRESSLAGTPEAQSMRQPKNVIPGGKAPKLRFKPGQFLDFRDGIWEVIYAYRLKEEPNEWLFCIEERKSLKCIEDDDTMGKALASLGCGENTPRIIFDLFLSGTAAMQFFGDITLNGHRMVVSTKQLMPKKVGKGKKMREKGGAKIISSGEVILPEDDSAIPDNLPIVSP